MNFLAVNYHYIGDEDEYSRGIHPVSVKRFRAQLQEIGKHFDFVGHKDINDALDGNSRLPENSCVVTFDDGVRSQYELALPVLREMGIPAIFFINGLPYLELRALFVHKIHWLRAHLSGDKFLNEIAQYFLIFTGKEFSLDLFNQMSDEQLRKIYPYDDIGEAKLKALLNKSSLDLGLREKMINSIFKSFVGDENDFCDKFYLTKSQVIDLYKNSSLGWHGYAHKPIALLNDKEMNVELHNANRVISHITEDPEASVNTISFPHTMPVSFKIAELAKDAGMKFGFTMEKAFNSTLLHPLLFARFDANDIPLGKKPLFDVNDGKIRTIGNDLVLTRREYFEE
jgi:peptidoglycan/xylan/chitin deacetylase (PgdA/CDA1 family)